MIHNIRVRNVNQALSSALVYLWNDGIEETSRNGTVVVAPGPVCTTYLKPMERVLFSPLRDANPLFHLMEAIWMLAGRNDVAWPTFFNSGFAQFSDNGSTFHGAYGYRWRRWFGYDQLSAIVAELKKTPNSRRCVLTMWDASRRDVDYDGGGYVLSAEGDIYVATHGGKDVPCNTHVYLDCRGGWLNATVCCRSNDIIWGAYGANAVHFSVLFEVLAAWIGVPLGEYRQLSNNFHIYTDRFPKDRWPALWDDSRKNDLYCAWNQDNVSPRRLLVDGESAESFLRDVEMFVVDPETFRGSSPFLYEVALPMYLAWKERKEGRGTGLLYVSQIFAGDWKRACMDWISRREAKKAQEVRR